MRHWERVCRSSLMMPRHTTTWAPRSRKTGRTEQAIGHYEEALRIRPDFAEAHYDLGVALMHLGRAQEAMAQWEQALRIKPDFAEAHCNLGNALERTGKIEGAVAHYEQAVRIKPDFVEAQFQVGVDLIRLAGVERRWAFQTGPARSNPIMPRRTATWGWPWSKWARLRRPSDITSRRCESSLIFSRGPETRSRDCKLAGEYRRLSRNVFAGLKS